MKPRLVVRGLGPKNPMAKWRKQDYKTVLDEGLRFQGGSVLVFCRRKEARSSCKVSVKRSLGKATLRNETKRHVREALLGLPYKKPQQVLALVRKREFGATNLWKEKFRGLLVGLLRSPTEG